MKQKVKVLGTPGTAILMKNKTAAEQVNKYIDQFLGENYGTLISENDLECNKQEPLHAMAAYNVEFPNSVIKIWIKRDLDVVTVMLPEEY